MSLPLADIKRGKVQSFRDVADALEGMASANRDMKRGVERLPIMGDGWKGVSGDAPIMIWMRMASISTGTPRPSRALRPRSGLLPMSSRAA